MSTPRPDMDLSEFMQLCVARQVPDTWDWVVEFTLFDGHRANLTILECYSEFGAKERAYFYLLDKIHNREK
jgi:hypothetical protein